MMKTNTATPNKEYAKNEALKFLRTSFEFDFSFSP